MPDRLDGGGVTAAAVRHCRDAKLAVAEKMAPTVSALSANQLGKACPRDQQFLKRIRQMANHESGVGK